MHCYEVPYAHRYGNFISVKWAETEKGALELVQKGHRKDGLQMAVGNIAYGQPRLSSPQPFLLRAEAPARIEATLLAFVPATGDHTEKAA